MRTFLFAVALLVAAPAMSQTAAPPAGERKLTLLVTGDNRGEIAPCG